MPARSLRTDPQWRHSQIYGDSKFWAPFDVEAASYNFGASDHYVPAVAMADAVGKEILLACREAFREYLWESLERI